MNTKIEEAVNLVTTVNHSILLIGECHNYCIVKSLRSLFLINRHVLYLPLNLKFRFISSLFILYHFFTHM